LSSKRIGRPIAVSSLQDRRQVEGNQGSSAIPIRWQRRQRQGRRGGLDLVPARQTELQTQQDPEAVLDRRHSLKLFGSYLWDFGLAVGGSLWYASGRPINGFGMHPTDPWTQASAFAPYNGPFSFYNHGEPCPRGCGSRTPETWALDLTARYDFRVGGADAYARLDVLNLIDNDAVNKVDEVAEVESLAANPDYLEPRFFQAPRTVRFGIGVNF
jgi:hypothetical protein